MTEEKAIAKTNGGSLAGFGDRDQIKELTVRLQATMPGGKRLSDVEARSLAQLSLAHGLDPFNGEAWIIPGSGLMVGIKGLRKTARRMAREEGGTYWIDIQRVEPKKYDAPDEAVVYEFHLRDTVSVQAWSKSINMMTEAGVSYEEAIKAIGPSPVVVGVGIATPDERSKMEIHARARKRAEADAIKQRYDVEFGNAQFSAEGPETVEGEYEVLPNEARSESEILSELGYEPENPDPITDEAWKEWLELVAEAEEKDIEVPEVERDRMTKTELRAEYLDLRKKVRAN